MIFCARQCRMRLAVSGTTGRPQGVSSSKVSHPHRRQRDDHRHRSSRPAPAGPCPGSRRRSNMTCRETHSPHPSSRQNVPCRALGPRGAPSITQFDRSGNSDHLQFESLAAEYGVDVASIRLITSPEGYRGIFASRDFRAGDVVLEVPHQLLLAASLVQRDASDTGGPVAGLGDSDSQHADLAAVLLACRLSNEGLDEELDALHSWLRDNRRAVLPDGQDALPEVWGRYSAEFVPPAEAQTSLVFFDEEELPQLQHSTLQQMVLDLYGEQKLPTFGQERLSGWAQWAIGSVHSRVFSTFAGGDVLMVPFADMLNHTDSPNCRFVSNLPCPLRQHLLSAAHDSTVFQVMANTDIAEGEELTISYGATKENWEMMLSYGFVPMGGNGADRIRLPERPPALTVSGLLRCTIQARYEGCSAPLISAACQTLEQTRSQLDREEELSRCCEAKEKVQRALDGFPTSIKEDLEALESVSSPGLSGPSLRRLAAVSYRLQRKEVLVAALRLLDILEENLRDSS